MTILKTYKGLWSKIIRSFPSNVILYLACVSAIIFLFVDLMSSFEIRWQWYRAIPMFISFKDGSLITGPLFDGLITTFQVSFLAFPLTMFFGLVVCLMKLSPVQSFKWLSGGYIGFIRNTPLIVQLYILYFLISPLLGMNRFFVGVLALSLFEGAYSAEIFRSGIESVGKKQLEAAKSLGLRPYYIARFIIFPQALRFVMPPMTNLVVVLVKHSSIVSIIAINDLTNSSRNQISKTFLNFEIWFMAGGIYLFLSIIIGTASRLIEKWLGSKYAY